MKHWRQVGNHLAMEGFPITIWTPGIHSSTSKCRERPKLLTPSMDALGRTYHLQRCVLSPKLYKLSQIFLTGLSHWTDRVTQEQVKGCKEEECKQMQKEGFFPRRLRVSQQTNDPPKKRERDYVDSSTLKTRKRMQCLDLRDHSIVTTKLRGHRQIGHLKDNGEALLTTYHEYRPLRSTVAVSTC